jgi:hypothetical protein
MRTSDASYLAGFFDGDGSIYFQLVRQEEYRTRPSIEEFLQEARQVDVFTPLNHSKAKRNTAADVEQHLRGMGVLAPVTTHSKATSSG